MPMLKELRFTAAGDPQFFVDHHGVLRQVAYCPWPGACEWYLGECTVEAMISGPKGLGKSLSLIMSFVQHVGRGFGGAWRGIIFRRTIPSLEELVRMALKFLMEAFPGQVTYNSTKHEFTWASGEVLRFAQCDSVPELDKYRGISYTFIGWDEATLWSTSEVLDSMYGSLRSAAAGVPKMVRLACNSEGPGVGWLKARYKLGKGYMEPVVGPLIIDDGIPRRHFAGRASDNLLLLHHDPHYYDRLKATLPTPAKIAALCVGSWQAATDGIISTIWDAAKDFCILPPFPVPATGKFFHSFDAGGSRPYSYQVFYCYDGGCDVISQGQVLPLIKNDLVLVHELYGWTGRVNQGLKETVDTTARKIRAQWRVWGLDGRIRGGPADINLFDESNGQQCRAAYMANEGVHFTPASKGPGSRIEGAEAISRAIQNTIPDADGKRTAPGLFVVAANVPQWMRTVPTLPRDPHSPDDADSDAEDHCWDATRYMLRHDLTPAVRSGRVQFGGHPQRRRIIGMR